jgi:plastocyanin
MIFTSLGLSLLALPTAMALQVFDVSVGLKGLVFDPPYVNASVGDIVNFVL